MESESDLTREMFHSQACINNATLSYINSMALKCAVELGIPEAIRLRGRPMSLPQLVDALSLPPPKSQCLARLMRVLVHSGLFAIEDRCGGQGEEYGLTPLSKYLSTGGSNYVRGVLQNEMVMPWLHLSSWFRDDLSMAPSPFQLTNGKGFYEYAGENQEFSDKFNSAMAHFSELETRQLVEECGAVFDGLESMVDVGGGTGAVARMILEAYPHLKCTVLDLPHVVENLEPAGNVDYVGGDMFMHIPPAKAVFLKWIMHNYYDADCLKILRRCKEAISSAKGRGKLIIVDMVLNVIKDVDFHKYKETQLLFDAQMMTIQGGKERTEYEWRNLFTQAGFTDYKITPLNFLCLIEVYP